MTFGEKCFNSLANARTKAGGVLNKTDWINTVDELYAQNVPSPNRKKKKTSDMTDEEWIESLEREPALAGVAVRTELAKAQFWCKNNNRKCTRRFFVNWLGKAERTVSHPGGKSVVRTGDIYTEPEGWTASERARVALGIGVESWALVVARGWLELAPDMRKDILRSL